MADRIVPDARVSPSAAPVDRFVSPVAKRAPETNGWLQAASALSKLEPSLQKFIENRYNDGAATAEAEGINAGNGVDAGLEFAEGREGWRQMISDVRKTDPGTADRMTGANPHFRRGMIKARMNRIGMGLNDHLMNLWRENPEVGGVPLHELDDTVAISQWMQDEAQVYSARFGVDGMDPLLVAEVYGKRVTAAQEQVMSRHTEFRLDRYNQEYLEEMSANTGLIMSGGGTSSSDAESFLNRLAGRESTNNYRAQNAAVGSSGRKGHYGRIQFGHDRLDDLRNAGVIPANMTAEEFLKDDKAQAAAELWHLADIDAFIRRGGYLDKGYSLDGLRAVAHLGGKQGMHQYIMSGGEYNPKDEYGTRLSQYYAKFSGPGSELQEVRDTAIADGMNPIKANKVVVESIIRTAIEAGNVEALDVLDTLQTNSGPLANVGWVKDARAAAEDKIEQDNYQAETRQYTLDQRARAQASLELQTTATRAILDDPYGVDLDDLQKQALALEDPTLATSLGTLQEQMIDRDYNVRPNHERIAELRMSISTGAIEDADFLKAIRQEVGINFSSAVATQLLDDFDNKDRYNDIIADRQIQSAIDDVGRVVSARFTDNRDSFNPIEGHNQRLEAEKILRSNIIDFLRDNPDASTKEAREYAFSELDRMLKSPVWQLSPAEKQGFPRERPYGELSDLATLLQSIPSDTTQMTTEQAQAVKDAADVLKITPDELLKFRSNP